MLMESCVHHHHHHRRHHHFIFHLFQDDEEYGLEGLSVSGKEIKKLLGRALKDYNTEHGKVEVCSLFYMPACLILFHGVI